MNKDSFGLSDEMKGIYRVIGELATSGLPDISKTIGANLLKTVSEFSAMTASLRQSASWLVQPDVLKPIIGALEWANRLPIQQAINELRRAIESPQYQAAIKGMAVFAQDFDWQWLADLQTEDAGVQSPPAEIIISEITEEDRKQVCEDVIEVLQQPEQMKVGIEQKYEKWKKNHPLQSDFFFQVFIPLLLWVLSFLSPSQSASTITNSNVYMEPVSNSTIVYQTTINQTINIIGDAPYYYNVQLVDPQTGTEYQGYICKRNVSVDSLMAEDDAEPIGIIPPASNKSKSVPTEENTTEK